MRNNCKASSCCRGFTPRPKFLGALKKRHPEKPTERLINYVWNNLISVITAVGLFIGGLVILAYLGTIQYFPQLDLSSSSLLIAAAAITGLILTSVLALYFVIPGYCYRHILHEGWKSCQNVTLNNSAIIWLLDVPTLVAYWLVIMATVFLPDDTGQLWYWSLLLTGLTLLGFVYFIKTTKEIRLVKKGGQEDVKTFAVATFSMLLLGCIALLPLLFILTLIVRYQQSVHNESLEWLALLEMSMFAIAMNHLIASSKKWWALFAVSPIVLFVILLVTQQWGLIPEIVVSKLALGNIQNVNLLLDEQGCQIADKNSHIIQDIPKSFYISKNIIESGADSKNNKISRTESVACILPSVTLLWRIGNEYFVEVEQAQSQAPLDDINKSGATKQFEKHHPQQQGKQISPGNGNKNVARESTEQPQLMPKSKFTIPSLHVLSWTVMEQKKANTQ